MQSRIFKSLSFEVQFSFTSEANTVAFIHLSLLQYKLSWNTHRLMMANGQNWSRLTNIYNFSTNIYMSIISFIIYLTQGM